MRISHYWPRHGGNVMALVLHRCGEMGKNAMSLLLRLALHSGEDRHGDFLGSFFFFFVVSLITDVMLPVSFGSVVGWCGFNEFVQLFRKCLWSKYDMKADFLVSLEHSQKLWLFG